MSKKSLLTFLFLASCAWSQPQVVATGLQTPHKLLLTPRGNFLVTEPNRNPNSGRVSFVSRSGIRKSLLEGLPSGTEVTLAGGSGPTAIALRDRTLYLAIGPGDSERPAETPGTVMHNPAGSSSPIFSSILEIRFSADVDTVVGPFQMTPQHQQTLNDGGEVEIQDTSGGSARVSILTRFPIAEPSPNVVYRFSNIWGLALSDDGRTLFVNDASMNAVMRVDTTTGRWRRLARFAPTPNPTAIGPPVIDAVPTSVRTYGEWLIVSFLTGFPFVPGNANVKLVHQETGASSHFIGGVTSATDLLWRQGPNARPQFFVLEFSANQSATPAPPGRLLRYDSPQGQVAATGLITPVSLAFDESTQDMFILELRGQIVRVHID